MEKDRIAYVAVEVPVFDRTYAIRDVLARSDTGQRRFDYLDRRREILERGESGELGMISGPDLIPRHPFMIDIDHEAISATRKKDVFGPAISVMEDLAKQRSIRLPNNPDNLVGRLLILDWPRFASVYTQELGADIDMAYTLGTVLPNRLCIINIDLIKEEAAQRESVDEDLLLREVGVHELWHSLSFMERWVPQNYPVENLTNNDLARRSGLITGCPPRRTSYANRMSPVKGNTEKGLQILNESYIDFLTRTVVQMLGQKDLMNNNQIGIPVVEALIKRIGENPLAQAVFTKRGFRAFYIAMETSLRPIAGDRPLRALPYFAELFGTEYDINNIRAMSGGKGPRSCTKTLKFIRTGITIPNKKGCQSSPK